METIIKVIMRTISVVIIIFSFVVFSPLIHWENGVDPSTITSDWMLLWHLIKLIIFSGITLIISLFMMILGFAFWSSCDPHD